MAKQYLHPDIFGYQEDALENTNTLSFLYDLFKAPLRITVITID